MAQPSAAKLDAIKPAAARPAIPWVRVVSGLLIVASVVVIMQMLPVDRVMRTISAAIVDLGVWGPALFVGIYIIATVLLIPGSAITLAGGAIFGLWVGSVTVSIGATLGAAAAFLVARYVARPRVEQRFAHSRKFRAIDRAVSEEGWKIVALLRLSPAVPFNLQNYAYGLTAIRFWPYVITSWLAMLPGTFMYVYLGVEGGAGVAAAAGASQRSWLQWTIRGIGLVATVIVTVYITKIARNALRRAAASIMEETKEDHMPNKDVSPRGSGRAATIAIMVLAGVFVAAAAVSCAWRDRIAALFGPPEVQMEEAYADKSQGATFSHEAFDALLRTHVNDRGGVDYAGLMRDRDKLQAYLNTLAEAPFDDLRLRDEKLALLINAYNAFTLELILENWDDGRLGSIMDIAEEKRWSAKRWKLAGGTTSLDAIEHELIRPKFKEPRIHFALVCAAVGCPPLRSEAYSGEKVEEQLAAQTEYVHTHDRWLAWNADRSTIRLTQLYNWYAGDFEQSAGSVLAYVARHDDALRTALDAGRPPRVSYLEYEWALNSAENVK